MKNKKEESTILNKEAEYEYKKFNKTVSHKSDSVTMILRSHLLAEHYLDQLIGSGIPRGDFVIDNNFTFIQKLIIVKSLDVIPSYILDSLKNLNTIRNQCVHVINYKVSENDIDKIGRTFGNEYSELKLKYLDNFKGLLYDILMWVIARLSGHTVRYVKRYLKEEE